MYLVLCFSGDFATILLYWGGQYYFYPIKIYWKYISWDSAHPNVYENVNENSSHSTGSFVGVASASI